MQFALLGGVERGRGDGRGPDGGVGRRDKRAKLKEETGQRT